MNLVEQQNALVEFYGEPVSVYTRAQAIEDGYLVDISSIAKECGFRYPVAITSDVFGDCVYLAKDDEKMVLETQLERTENLLRELMKAIKRTDRSVDRITFALEYAHVEGCAVRDGSAKLTSVVGPGDTLDPVITISRA